MHRIIAILNLKKEIAIPVSGKGRNGYFYSHYDCSPERVACSCLIFRDSTSSEALSVLLHDQADAYG